MIRRLGLAVVVAGMALAGLATGTAAAAPACADYHWLGAAGSGQRDGAGLTANGGMGGVVYQSYLQMRDELAASGRTITAEAVQYPAAPVPLEGGLGGWMDFMDSVKEGADATATQFEAFTEQCPNTKVVLAGYSQGAMVIHRNLEDLADDPHVAAALLIADGDRLPVDTTIKLGSTAVVPPSARVSPRSTRSWRRPPLRRCRPRWAPGPSASATSATRSVTATPTPTPTGCRPPPSRSTRRTRPAASGAHAWGTPLYQLVMNAAPAPSPTSTTALAAHGS